MNKFLSKLAAYTRKHPFKGMGWILRFLHNPDFVEKKSIKGIISYAGGIKINIDTSSFIEWEIFFKGFYEEEIARILSILVKPGFVAFDVGANIGAHSLLMANLVGEGGRVIAFEPFSPIADRLLENKSLNNLNNLEVLRIGLSNENGDAILYTPISISHKGNASLYRNHSKLDGEQKINLKRLDDVFKEMNLSNCDLIKVDIEGNEYKALIGGKEIIDKYRPYVIFEFYEQTWANSGYDWEDCFDIFNDNYVFYGIDRNSIQRIEGRPTSNNILAVPINKLDKELENKFKHYELQR